VIYVSELGIELLNQHVNKQEMDQIADLWDVTPCTLVHYESTHIRGNVKYHM
jgi:hypothetical protein